ncbi:MAG: hypothetical protein DRN20_03220 [Thermoplasmata archaeon]|nr:MAG: hypothetical protein DRN20_03220 [Thermoplasmata archaeon]
MNPKPLFEIIRPHNCLMSFIAVLIGAYVSVSILEIKPIIGALVAFLYTAAGNSMNDYFDRYVDRINRPERPIPSGRINESTVLALSILLFLVGYVLLFTINIYAIMLGTLNLIVLVLYNARIKRKAVAANITIAYLSASLFLFGAICANGLGATPLLMVTAFLATWSREVVKDVEDVEGDIFDRKTLPMIISRKRALDVAFVLNVLAIVVGLCAYVVFPTLYYIIPLLISACVFIYSSVIAYQSPSKGQRIAKVAMFIALISFIGGAYAKGW